MVGGEEGRGKEKERLECFCGGRKEGCRKRAGR